MKHSIVSKLYDLLVYLTANYSQMSQEFKDQFPEADCVRIRQNLFNLLSVNKNGK